MLSSMSGASLSYCISKCSSARLIGLSFKDKSLSFMSSTKPIRSLLWVKQSLGRKAAQAVAACNEAQSHKEALTLLEKSEPDKKKSIQFLTRHVKTIRHQLLLIPHILGKGALAPLFQDFEQDKLEPQALINFYIANHKKPDFQPYRKAFKEAFSPLFAQSLAKKYNEKVAVAWLIRSKPIQRNKERLALKKVISRAQDILKEAKIDDRGLLKKVVLRKLYVEHALQGDLYNGRRESQWNKMAKIAMAYPQVFKKYFDASSGSVPLLWGEKDKRLSILGTRVAGSHQSSLLSFLVEKDSLLYRLYGKNPKQIAAELQKYAYDQVANAHQHPFAANMGLMLLRPARIEATLKMLELNAEQAKFVNEQIQLPLALAQKSLLQIETTAPNLGENELHASKELITTEKSFWHDIDALATDQNLICKTMAALAEPNTVELNKEALDAYLQTVVKAHELMEPFETVLQKTGLGAALASKAMPSYVEGLIQLTLAYHHLIELGVLDQLSAILKAKHSGASTIIKTAIQTARSQPNPYHSQGQAQKNIVERWISNPGSIAILAAQRGPRWPMTVKEATKNLLDKNKSLSDPKAVEDSPEDALDLAQKRELAKLGEALDHAHKLAELIAFLSNERQGLVS